MRKIALGLAVVMTLFGFGATAHAQYTNPPGVTVSDSSPAPGGTFVVNVTGCQPNSPIAVSFGGASSTVNADASGNAAVTLTAPTTAGTANGSTTCNGQTTNFTVQVQAPADSTPPTQGGDAGGGLPATGSDGTGTTTTVAIGRLIVGLGLFVVAQTRRRQSAHA